MTRLSPSDAPSINLRAVIANLEERITVLDVMRDKLFVGNLPELMRDAVIYLKRYDEAGVIAVKPASFWARIRARSVELKG